MVRSKPGSAPGNGLAIHLFPMANYLPGLLAAGALLFLQGCNSGSTSTEQAAAVGEQGPAMQANLKLPQVTPVPLPNPGIAGYKFPEDSATIDKWVQARQTAAINLHGWGIWTALTTMTDETYAGDKLRVYETWHTKAEVNDLVYRQDSLQAKSDALASFSAVRARPFRRHLEQPVQFFRDPHLRRKMRAAHSMLGATAEVDNPVFEAVNYDPTAAQTIVSRRLFMPAVLDKMLKAGRSDIPDFPHSSVVVKPVYEVVPGPNHKGASALYKMNVWARLPTSQVKRPRAFDQNKWGTWVYIDINDKGQGRGQVYYDTARAHPAPAAYTYNLRDFIHHKLDTLEARQLNAKRDASDHTVVEAGDYAVLVAMHITTREIQRWTWQTMWWAPNPDQAPAPSDRGVVAARPAQLKDAPRHYAMGIAYQMIDPVQPYSGGTNQGRPIYVFNPYLEASFGQGVFGDKALVRTPMGIVTDSVGTQTNCMSCHGHANHSLLADTINNPQYVADTYIDMRSPKFRGRLKTDFLWSVADMARHNRKRLQALVKP